MFLSADSPLFAKLYCIVPVQIGTQPPPTFSICLESTEIQVNAFDLSAEVTVQQTYINNVPRSWCSADSIECTYQFPLDEQSAVCDFSASMDGRTVQGEIKEKQQARTEYRQAVRAGQSAMMLEEKAANVFEASIGNLRYGSRCVITIKYLTQLDQEGEYQRFVLPTSIAPKYTPIARPTIASAFVPLTTTAPAQHDGIQCDACMIKPIVGTRFKCTVCADFDLCSTCEARNVHQADHPMLKMVQPQSKEKHLQFNCDGCSMRGIRGARYRCQSCSDFDLCDACYAANRRGHPLGQADHAFRRIIGEGATLLDAFHQAHDPSAVVIVRPQSMSLDLVFSTPSPIQDVQIQCDAVQLQKHQPFATQCRVQYRPTPGAQAHLEKDVVILIKQRNCNAPRVLLEIDPVKQTGALQLAFIPPPVPATEAIGLSCEFMFLIDRSGSMQGSKMNSVRSAMELILKSLPTNCKFNIIGFGSTYTSLWPKSQAYTDATLAEASAHCRTLNADLGGTEILQPLKQALSETLVSTFPRQIFLISDGQVSNTAELVKLTASYAHQIRVFTFGIGNDVDRFLCKALAEAGNGACEFVGDNAPEGELRMKTTRQFERACQPVLADVQVDWCDFAPAAPGMFSFLSSASATKPLEQAPVHPPAIFPGTRSVIYALNVKIPPEWLQLIQGTSAAGGNMGTPKTITISAFSNRPNASGLLRFPLTVDFQCVTQGTVIHRLAARTRIKEWEQQDIVDHRKEILDLALEHRLTSAHTSFLVVYKTENAAPTSSVAEIRSTVPPPTPSFGHAFSVNSASLSSHASLQCFSTNSTNSSSGWGGSRGAVNKKCASRGVAVMESCKSKDRGSMHIQNEMMDSDDEEEAEDELQPQSFSFNRPVPKPTAVVLRDKDHAFQLLLSLQEANGSFRNERVVVSKIVTFLLDIQRATACCDLLQSHVEATLLALKLLQDHFPASKYPWAMIAAKAQNYLNTSSAFNTAALTAINTKLIACLN